MWWEVMCRVWHAYRLLWCLCLNVSACTELRVEYQGFSTQKSSHSVFAYRFWTKLPLYWLPRDCNCISTPQPARVRGVTALYAKMLTIQDKGLLFFFHKYPPTEWDVPGSNTALTQIHHQIIISSCLSCPSQTQCGPHSRLSCDFSVGCQTLFCIFWDPPVISNPYRFPPVESDCYRAWLISFMRCV